MSRPNHLLLRVCRFFVVLCSNIFLFLFASHSFVHGRLPYDNIKPDPVLKQILKNMRIRKLVRPLPMLMKLHTPPSKWLMGS